MYWVGWVLCDMLWKAGCSYSLTSSICWSYPDFTRPGSITSIMETECLHLTRYLYGDTWFHPQNRDVLISVKWTGSKGNANVWGLTTQVGIPATSYETKYVCKLFPVSVVRCKRALCGADSFLGIIMMAYIITQINIISGLYDSLFKWDGSWLDATDVVKKISLFREECPVLPWTWDSMVGICSSTLNVDTSLPA